MPRAIFEKTGNAIYISHLDLMRVFQRAFKRAGLQLTHTQGFSPRPSVSIALPLSVGVESHCELLDFDLEGELPSCEEIQERLNGALIEGVRVLSVYSEGGKQRDIAFLDCAVTLEYDRCVTDGDREEISGLFKRESLMLEKKGKNGTKQQDIIPLIRKLDVVCAGDRKIRLNAQICCLNPALNPAQLVAAIAEYLPEKAPAFAQVTRLEIYDQNENVFR
ncbi:MAG: DUF2344 domain-containing protein [Ruminococcaceae bacterium]|nr:DUF2344 domain-containing protein [Oscillospiraceae bacterium]